MSDDGQELLTVAEAAGRLGVSIPRLRRLLAHPEWSQHTHTIERETKTGTRTSTVVPVSVLPAIQSAISERERNQTGANRSSLDGQLAPTVQKALSDKDGEIAFLREQVQAMSENLAREQIAHAETRRMIAATSRAEPEPETRTETEPKRSRSWWPFRRKEPQP